MVKKPQLAPLADTYHPFLIRTTEITLKKHPDSWHTIEEITQLIIKGRSDVPFQSFQVDALRWRIRASLQNLLQIQAITSEEMRKTNTNIIIKRYKINP
jgi:hypothetical protein